MDTYASNSWQAGNREYVDNRQYSSELQSNGKHRNNQSSNRSGKDVFSSGGRPSVHGHLLMENIQWIEGGLRAPVGVLQVIGMGMVVGVLPLVVGPVTGHLAGTNLTIIAKIILMAAHRSK